MILAGAAADQPLRLHPPNKEQHTVMLDTILILLALFAGLAIGHYWRRWDARFELEARNAKELANIRERLAASGASQSDLIGELTLAHVLIDDLQAQRDQIHADHERLWAHYTGAHDELARRDGRLPLVNHSDPLADHEPRILHEPRPLGARKAWT